MADFEGNAGRFVSAAQMKTIPLGQLLVVFRLQKAALERIAIDSIEEGSGPVPEWVRAVGDLISESTDIEHHLRGLLPHKMWSAVDTVAETRWKTYIERVERVT